MGYPAPKKNHVKVLICSLQNVLWPGHSWKAVGMDKMSDNNNVKKFYRKAMMMVHPDKISQSNITDPDILYISNRVFAALNDAFNDFKNEPGVRV